MSRTEIKIGGLGGQGVILTGMVIGRAAAIYENRSAEVLAAHSWSSPTKRAFSPLWCGRTFWW